MTCLPSAAGHLLGNGSGMGAGAGTGSTTGGVGVGGSGWGGSSMRWALRYGSGVIGIGPLP